MSQAQLDGVAAGPCSAAVVHGCDPSPNAEVCGKTTLHAASCSFLASVREYDAPKSLACAGLRAIVLFQDPLAATFVVVEGAVQGALDRQSPFLIQRGVRIRLLSLATFHRTAASCPA